MTTAAVGPEFTIVIIVGPVTIATVPIDVFHLVEWAAMAVVAGDGDMSALEQKVGLLVVIERPYIPADRVVAGVAAVKEVAAMRVVLSVTGSATAFCIGESLGGVAILTFILFVHAVQRESCQVVVEKYRVLPVDLGVTALALHARSALMWIVVQVASVTGGREFDFEYRLEMAINASDFLVPAKQPVVGMLVMVKKRFGPLGALMAIATLIAMVFFMRIVFEMARGAFRFHVVFERVFGMAVAADQLGVFAFKRKIRVTDMVEAGVVPVGRVMTAVTLLAATAIVRVVFFMT